MGYHIDAENVTLDDVRHRIDNTDLVPSRAPLLDGLESHFAALKAHGISTLRQLRGELKTPKRLAALSDTTGIAVGYLTLLRRETESWFPKPPAVTDFDWLPADDLAKLKADGIRDAAALYTRTRDARSRAAVAEAASVGADVVESLARLVDLTRVQWVSPVAARMLAEVNCDSAARLAGADAETLCEDLAKVNEGDRYFKGKIGLRDVKRLVRSARYVPH